MNTAHISALLNIGQLSLDLRAAELTAEIAKSIYHTAWRAFELDDEPCQSGEDRYVAPEDRIRAGHPNWSEAQEATAKQFAAYQAAKRAAYNVKRRWMNACRTAKHQISNQGAAA